MATCSKLWYIRINTIINCCDDRKYGNPENNANKHEVSQVLIDHMPTWLRPHSDSHSVALLASATAKFRMCALVARRTQNLPDINLLQHRKMQTPTTLSTYCMRWTVVIRRKFQITTTLSLIKCSDDYSSNTQFIRREQGAPDWPMGGTCAQFALIHYAHRRQLFPVTWFTWPLIDISVARCASMRLWIPTCCLRIPA